MIFLIRFPHEMQMNIRIYWRTDFIQHAVTEATNKQLTGAYKE